MSIVADRIEELKNAYSVTDYTVFVTGASGAGKSTFCNDLLQVRSSSIYMLTKAKSDHAFLFTGESATQRHKLRVNNHTAPHRNQQS